MNYKFIKIGGILFFVTIIGTETSPLFCRLCFRVSEPHIFERNYGAEYNQIPFFAVSSISGTTASTRI